MKGVKRISIMLAALFLMNLFAGITTAYAQVTKNNGWDTTLYEKAKAYKILPKYLKKHVASDPMTREATVEFLIKIYESKTGKKVKPVNPNPFTDTKNKAVLKAYALGIIKGVSATEFQPDGLINREELCVVYFKLLKLLVPNYTCDWAAEDRFVDNDQISDWAMEAVYSFKYLDLVKGYAEDNTFRPQAGATLEEGLKFAVEFYEYSI